jgi:mRNA interferase MazF
MSFIPGDIVTVDFPGVKGIKRRPAIILSSSTYNLIRPDVILGLITSKTKNLDSTDYLLKDWSEAGLKVPSIFRSFIITLPVSTNFIKIGHVSQRDWKGICHCLKVAFANSEDWS